MSPGIELYWVQLRLTWLGWKFEL